MSLLDPTAISDPDDYTPEDFRDKGPRSAVIWLHLRHHRAFLDQSGPRSRYAGGGTSPHLPPYPRAVPAAAPLAPPVLAAASASFALRLIYRITATTLGRSILWRDRSNCFAQRNLPHIPQSPRVLRSAPVDGGYYANRLVLMDGGCSRIFCIRPFPGYECHGPLASARYLFANGPQIDHRNTVNRCERTCTNATKNIEFI